MNGSKKPCGGSGANEKQEGADEITGSADKITGGGRFPEWFDYLIIIAVFLGGSVLGLLCSSVLERTVPGIERELLTAAAYTVQLSAMIAGTFVYLRLRRGPCGVFRFSLKWYNASLVLWGLALIVTGGVVMEPVLRLFPERYMESLDNAIGSGGWAILTVVLIAPVLEEMLFRGLLLEPARRKWGASAAILISSLLFGFVHLPIPPQMLNAFVMGIMLGYVYVLADSLVPVIIIHAANNALAFLMREITGTQNTDLSDLTGGGAVYWMIYAVCFAVFAFSMASMAAAAGRQRKRIEIAAVFSAVPAEGEEERENECEEADGNNNNG